VSDLHLGIDQYVRPIDSSSRFWLNRVAGDRTMKTERQQILPTLFIFARIKDESKEELDG
jgi:hypothetical protein